MNFLYKNIIKPIFFLFPADDVHQFILKLGNFLGKYRFKRNLTKTLFHYENERLEQNIAGITFKNPVGLSAGFDKDADLVDILPSVGFGFSQVGTVTLNPYKGNTQPWSTRLKKSKALTVYFGLKNIGVAEIIKRLKIRKVKDFPISISIGKTNAAYTASDEAGVKDYVDCLKEVENAGVGDFYTINISCPNMFGGESFATKERLSQLLKEIKKVDTSKPIFLKMPINPPWEEIKELCDVAIENEITGVIYGNLNKDHSDPDIIDPIPENIKGNISGKPCNKFALDLVSKTYREFGDKLVIVGVGGIFSAEDAYKMIEQGASLVQLITGMIFEGPQLIGNINRGLVKQMQKDGYDNISEVVGSAHRGN